MFDADVMAVFNAADVAAQGAVLTSASLNAVPGTTNGAVPAVGTSGTDTLPAGTMVALVAMVETVPFVSGSATSLTIKVGDTGSNVRYLAATQLQSGQTPVQYAVGVIANQPYIYTAADKIQVVFVSVTANLSTFTAGEVVLYFKCQDVTQLPIR